MVNNSNIKLIISDIDGTLLEYVTLKDIVMESLDFFNIPRNDKYYDMQCTGVAATLTEAAKEKTFCFERLCYYWQEHMSFLKDYNINVEDFASKMISLEAKYSQEIPNANKTLEFLKEEYNRIICSTNWFHTSQRSKLEKLDMNRHIDKIYTCEGIYAKPNQKHFEFILESENVTPQDVIMIGDSFTDVSASQIGIRTILLDRGSNKQSIYPYSTFVVNDFEEIRHILKK